jgi:hypothetical protein
MIITLLFLSIYEYALVVSRYNIHNFIFNVFKILNISKHFYLKK